MKPVINQIIHRLAEARSLYTKASDEGLILKNDNYIDDIGIFWVKEYFGDNFLNYSSGKKEFYQIRLKDKKRVLVKTYVDWNAPKKGPQIKTEYAGQNRPWDIFAAVYLDEELKPNKIALIPHGKLLKQREFSLNKKKRILGEIHSFPSFRWWDWLEEYRVK